MGSQFCTNNEDNFPYSSLVSVCVSIPTDAPPATTSRPKCEGFTCPNNDPEGGLFPYDKDGCGPQFCDCSYGTPWLLECEEANPPLFFNPEQEVCDWCFNMCDKCASKCPMC